MRNFPDALDNIPSPSVDVADERQESALQPSTDDEPQGASSVPAGFPVERSDGVYVQMGAFGSAKNAKALVERLRLSGVDNVRVAPPMDERDGFHRVLVGPGLAEARRSLRERNSTRRKQPSGNTGVKGFVVRYGGMRYIQVGAFGTRWRAHRLMDGLRRQSIGAVVHDETQPDGWNLYKVRVGPLETDQAVAEAKRQLAGAGDNG